MAVGHTAIDGGVVAPGGLQIIVATVTDIAESGPAHARGLGEQGNQVRADRFRYVAGLNPAISEAVVHNADRCPRQAFADDLLGLHRTFQTLGSKGGDIERIVVERGEREPPIRAVEPTRGVVTDKAALLQAAYVALEGNGVVAATKVKTGHAKRHARAHSGLSQTLVGASLKLQSQAVTEGVTLGFLRFHEDVLFPLIPLGILHRGIHLAEDTEAVQALLRLQHVDLAQRIT